MVTTHLNILELRSVRGTGGGPEKTILFGAARADRSRFRITVCYVRDDRDPVFGIDARASQLGVDYVEIRERHSFDCAIWRPLRSLVRERGIDIVHAHDYKTDLLALLLGAAEGVVPLATAHGWTGRSRRERHLYYPLDRKVLARFPHVVAVSSAIRDELVKAGADAARVTTILNGIDPDAFRRQAERRDEARLALGIRPDAVVVGSIGRLEPQKRFDHLMRACAALRAHHPTLTLLIAGDGSLRDSLEALKAAVFPEGGCELLGHRADVVQLHHAFDLFVQASDYEGTPNAVLEAMAMETPLVATDVGGTRELAAGGVHALIVPPNDPDALARAIDAALRDRAAAADRVAAARRRIERELSFEARMHSLESIYQQLALLRRGPRRAQRLAGWA